MSGTLYIVATPIGNLQDISLRALKTLFEVDVIACEDTRRTGLLYQQLQAMHHRLVHDPSLESNKVVGELKKPRLISYYEQNELQRIPEIISALKDNISIALVSDAGTPTVSDPGFKLVRECIKEGIKVESIPGPSSVILALTLSGLPTDKFFFFGYPPRKEGHRKQLFESLKTLTGQLKTTAIFFEAPHRIIGTLEELKEIYGKEKYIVICREMTKIHEEVLRDSIENLLSHFSKTNPKGEFVFLLSTE